MNKMIFHNYKKIKENLNVDFTTPLQNKKKLVVDINKLLNRIKVDQNSEKKQKIVFFSLGVLLIGFMGIFVSIIR